MPRQYDNRNTTRKEDWSRFGAGLIMLPIGILGAFVLGLLKVLHDGKNIVVEEARRWGWELNGDKEA